jgi:hypothetical protein
MDLAAVAVILFGTAPLWGQEVQLPSVMTPSRARVDSLFAPTNTWEDSWKAPFAADPADSFQAVDSPWSFQVLPNGLIYRSYLAGGKEPRLGSAWVHDRDYGWIWDIALGGRAGLFRYGTDDPLRPQGFQLDVEGAALPRLDFEHERDLMAVDFRAGVPLTFGFGRYQTKFGYYHLSSHLGDEFMVRMNTLERINYSRDVLIWGHSFSLTDDIRLYAEAGWAFYADGGSKPWEFQFGAEYSPLAPTGPRGAPFLAVNGHLREELDFGGSIVVQAGWQWRGTSGQRLRTGVEYYVGKSDQFEFFNQYENKVGVGLWYDF